MTKRKPDAASKRGPKPKRHSGPPKRHNSSQPDPLLVENPETASSETVLSEAVLSEAALSETALPEAALPETVLPETVSQNAPEQTTDNGPKQGIGFSYANANLLAYQAKLVEMAQANMQFAFEFAHRLATIRSPVELPGVIAELTNKRIAMFWKHSREIAQAVDIVRPRTSTRARENSLYH
jgi:hypothetical protein